MDEGADKHTLQREYLTAAIFSDFVGIANPKAGEREEQQREARYEEREGPGKGGSHGAVTTERPMSFLPSSAMAPGPSEVGEDLPFRTGSHFLAMASRRCSMRPLRPCLAIPRGRKRPTIT